MHQVGVTRCDRYSEHLSHTILTFLVSSCNVYQQETVKLETYLTGKRSKNSIGKDTYRLHISPME